MTYYWYYFSVQCYNTRGLQGCADGDFSLIEPITTYKHLAEIKACFLEHFKANYNNIDNAAIVVILCYQLLRTEENNVCQ